MEERTTQTARIWRDNEGIVHYVSIGVASTEETVAEGMAALGELTGGVPLPILFDSRGWPSGDPASWVRFINSIETVCSAAAVIVDDQSESLLGSFPDLLHGLLIPFKLFSDEEEAREFLRDNQAG